MAARVAGASVEGVADGSAGADGSAEAGAAGAGEGAEAPVPDATATVLGAPGDAR